MAIYNITQNDIFLLRNNKRIYARVYLLDNENKILDTIEGYVTSGDGSEDADSDIRRTCNFVLHSYDSTYNVGEYNRIWLNRRVRIELGFEDIDKIYWYNQGIFKFDTCSYTYDGSTRDISISCSDLVSTINGTHNGLILGECPKCGIPLVDCKEHRGKMFVEGILIKGCTFNEETELYEGNDIKKVVEDLLDQYGIKERKIDVIGQVSCLQGYAVNWKQNRMDTGSTQDEVDLAEEYGDTAANLDNDHGTWHMIPYDMEFDNNVTLWDVLVKIRDLYPGYEMFFDKDGVFVFQLIPICHHDMNVLTYTQFDGLVLSENVDLDLTSIRNATQVYGQSIETDRFADESIFEETEYTYETKKETETGTETITNTTTVLSAIPSLEKFFYKGDIVLGVVFNNLNELSDNQKELDAYITLTTTEEVEGSVGEETTEVIKTHPITKREASVISYESFSETKNYVIGDTCSYQGTVYKFILDKSAGEWVYEVVERLTTSDSSSDISNLISYIPMKYKDFNNTDMYCFKYLQKQQLWVYAGMYQIEGYYENNDENSPFSIDKIGYRLQILSGGDYDNITTSTLANERAEYETWLKSRLTDTITLETVIIPFLETNQKIQYKKLSDGSIDSYIIKSLSYSFMDGTMTITMMKFYELDPFIVCS